MRADVSVVTKENKKVPLYVRYIPVVCPLFSTLISINKNNFWPYIIQNCRLFIVIICIDIEIVEIKFI